MAVYRPPSAEHSPTGGRYRPRLRTTGLQVINATLKLTKAVAKKATGRQEIILTALDITSITSCKDVSKILRTMTKH